MIEEEIEQYEEEDYEETRCSTLVKLHRDDVDGFLTPSYDESIWQRPTSVGGQVFNGKNYKKYS